MRPSRRQVFQSALALPFVSLSQLPILTEDHCLSRESALGFRKIVRPTQNTIVVAAFRNLNPLTAAVLKHRVQTGATLIFETAPDYSLQQAQLLASEFALHVSPALPMPLWAGEYANYSEPVKHLIRPFIAAVPVHSQTAQVLAQIGGITVAVSQRLGRGRMIFLGSMLGPNLFAEEREARAVALSFVSQK